MTASRPGPLGDLAPFLGGHDLEVPVPGATLMASAWDGAPDRVGTVLLHGLSQQRRFWRPVVRRLAGLPLATLDQRGHGDTGGSGPYDMATLAGDVVALLDALGWDRAVVVGHSWGAAVAMHVGAAHPDRVAAVVAVDGGTTSPGEMGDRDEVRRRLEPPRLAVPPDELVPMLRSGGPRDWFDEDVEQAVLPTFEVGADGLVRTRIGFERHMAVLDGLLDHDAAATMAAVRCPAWVVFCSPVPAPGVDDDPAAAAWRRARAEGRDRALRLLARPRVLEWVGAVHDVPLQWPALVAGLVRSAGDEASRPRRFAEGRDGGER